MSAKKVKVDQEKCIGCGSCQMIAPELFELNDEMKSEYIGGEMPDEEKLQEAIDVCPVEAITKE